MFAVRTGGIVKKKNPELKKQQNLEKVSLDKENTYSIYGQRKEKFRILALLHQLEMNWYLKICESSYEYTVAHTSGMPHR